MGCPAGGGGGRRTTPGGGIRNISREKHGLHGYRFSPRIAFLLGPTALCVHLTRLKSRYSRSALPLSAVSSVSSYHVLCQICADPPFCSRVLEGRYIQGLAQLSERDPAPADADLGKARPMITSQDVLRLLALVRVKSNIGMQTHTWSNRKRLVCGH